MSVYNQKGISPNNLPVVRYWATRKPMQMNTVNFCRSEVIRQLFLRQGNIPDGAVLDYLRSQGMTCSPSLIQKQRKELLSRGLLAAK